MEHASPLLYRVNRHRPNCSSVNGKFNSIVPLYSFTVATFHCRNTTRTTPVFKRGMKGIDKIRPKSCLPCEAIDQRCPKAHLPPSRTPFYHYFIYRVHFLIWEFSDVCGRLQYNSRTCIVLNHTGCLCRRSTSYPRRASHREPLAHNSYVAVTPRAIECAYRHAFVRND